MKVSTIIIIGIISTVLTFAGAGYLVYSIVSWATSGEAGEDIGEFAGDVKKGYEGDQ